jgi:hypothetical protein
MADGIRRFVEAGGYAVAEARLAWNDERGHASEIIPGLGLHEVFGVREQHAWMIDEVTDHGLTPSARRLREGGGRHFSSGRRICEHRRITFAGCSCPGDDRRRAGHRRISLWSRRDALHRHLHRRRDTPGNGDTGSRDDDHGDRQHRDAKCWCVCDAASEYRLHSRARGLGRY